MSSEGQPREPVDAGSAGSLDPAQTDRPASTRPGRVRQRLASALGVAVSLFVLVEVNVAGLSPLKALSLFATAGLLLCFLTFPCNCRWGGPRLGAAIDGLLSLLAIGCCGYVMLYGSGFGAQAAAYATMDLLVGGIGSVLVLEATRRAIGLALPILALLFVLYAHESVAQQLPDWLFPHRGQDVSDLIGQTYLRTEGVFGTALGVMFKYVFLFVVFGAFLEASGATGYIIALATRLFGKRAGGPAKVSVLASGLMGSLSGSAVANAATTGTFTIPLMRSIGFRPHIAAGVEAAASSGGALVPPVMGAGAYMMLEIINRDPPVQYLEIIQAAIIPAVLYYLSIFLLVHFYAKRIDAAGPATSPEQTAAELQQVASELAAGQLPASKAERRSTAPPPILSIEGVTFFGALGSLMLFLLYRHSPFRSVTYSLIFVMLMMLLNPRIAASLAQRLVALAIWLMTTSVAYLWLAQPWQAVGSRLWNVSAAAEASVWGFAATLLLGLTIAVWRHLLLGVFQTAGRSGTPLIVAAACVGIIIGLVSRTGIGTGVPQAIIPLAGNSLFLALLAIMGCSIVLGMGLPSAVSYLLLATVIGPVFADPALGVPILAAHLFIFYFGMMAMVTPPVALAAYATASIAGSGVMQTGLAAFRFALVGFTLPYMFVYRPELCLMAADGGRPEMLAVLTSVTAAVLGILALAAAMAGYLLNPLGWGQRLLLFAAAACSLYPDTVAVLPGRLSLVDLAGAIVLAAVVIVSYRRHAAQQAGASTQPQ